MVHDLFANIAIVVAFLFIIGQVFGKYPLDARLPLQVRILMGLCFGGLGIVLMLYSIDVTSTIIVDLRNTAIICAAVMGGPVAVIIASSSIAVYRVMHFGVSNASIVAMIVALALGIGCSLISKVDTSRFKRFYYMLLLALAMSTAAFIYLMRDLDKILGLFVYYIPISFFGVLLAHFAVEYIVYRQIIEQKLKKSNEEISDVLESIQDAFFTIDPNWRFTYVNREFIRILNNYDKKYGDLLGKYTWDVFPQEQYSHFYNQFCRVMIEKAPVSFEGYSQVSNHWYHVNVYPKNNGISVYFRDITEYKTMAESLRESEARFRTAFEFAAVGMAIVAIEGKFISANEPYCNMVGYSLEELNNITFLQLTHPDDLSGNNEVIKKLLDGDISSFHIEKRYIHKDGHIIWVQVNTSLLRDKDGRPKYFIAQAQDITNRIIAAEELKRINAELLEQRTEADRKREEAMEANKHKGQFLAAMSHELRTPLNSIIGFTNRVIKKCSSLLPQTQLENLQIVRDEGEHLLELINSLLDYSKIEAGKMEVYAEEFDLKDAIYEVTTMTRNIAEGKKLNYRQQLPATEDILIYSDKLKVKQILINLLSNAFKYSEKGTVTLSVIIVDRFYRITVEDEGIGISTEHIERIFDEFRQVDGTYTRKVGGTGLGLSITKKFVEMLGGSIEAQSSLGAGSRFIVLLPIRYSE